MGCTIDIDTGGTFTDGFITRDGRVEIVKVPTTPHDLTICFLECIKQGAARLGLSATDFLHETDIIRFSNTIGTNCLIIRDGSKVGMIVTAGAEHLTPSHSEGGKPPLVLPDMVLGIEERVSDSGEVLVSPSEETVLGAAQELIDRGARCLVLCFRNSEVNSANERAAYQVIKREYPRDYLGAVPVFLSSNISVRSGELERINATVVNAYIHEKLATLLYKAGENLRKLQYNGSLLIGHNNGAVARVAKTRAINTYNSGPAGGLMGAQRIGQLYGADFVLSADMGGTSFDIGYVREGRPADALRSDIEGFAVNIPMLNIRAIGAGGGSIASVRGGELRVGPESAGAVPGPAGFGLGGTEPTVTDANLALGLLDPSYFLGGTMKLHLDKARAALRGKVAEPLGTSVEEAAWRVKRAVEEYMGQSTKRLKEEAGSGIEALLVVYGGAGPAHCCEVARIAGIRKVVLTPFSSVFSAFGSSTMDVGHVYYRRINAPLSPEEAGRLGKAVAEMRREAERDFRGEGFPVEQVRFSVELLVHSSANAEEVRVITTEDFAHRPSGIECAAREARELLDSTVSGAAGSITVSTVSLRAHALLPHYEMPRSSGISHGVEEARQKGSRAVFLDPVRGTQSLPVYELSALKHGHRLLGPSIVESETTTIFVQSGWELAIDEYGNSVLEEAP